jgi:hypothetical protein
MMSKLDVLALANEVEHDSQTGKLSRELLAQGNTLYGKNAAYSDYIERITPDGQGTLGYWSNEKFEAVISLLELDSNSSQI